MADYLIRDIPEDVHRKAMRRAEREGRTLKWVLVQAMREYGEGRWTPTYHPPS